MSIWDRNMGLVQSSVCDYMRVGKIKEYVPPKATEPEQRCVTYLYSNPNFNCKSEAGEQ